MSLTTHGSVFVWAYMISQNWEVYAPGFRSLTQNEEYVESETEFDLSPTKGDDEDKGAEEPETVCSKSLALSCRHRCFPTQAGTCCRALERKRNVTSPYGDRLSSMRRDTVRRVPRKCADRSGGVAARCGAALRQ